MQKIVERRGAFLIVSVVMIMLASFFSSNFENVITGEFHKSTGRTFTKLESYKIPCNLQGAKIMADAIIRKYGCHDFVVSKNCEMGVIGRLPKGLEFKNNCKDYFERRVLANLCHRELAEICEIKAEGE